MALVTKADCIPEIVQVKLLQSLITSLGNMLSFFLRAVQWASFHPSKRTEEEM